jgi:Tfp pilus assembly protein PilN
MKVTLNLAALPGRRERYALAWSVPLAVLGAAGFVLLARFAVVNVREYQKVQKEIVRLEDQNRQLAHQEDELRKIVGQPEYQTISSEAQYVNSLIEAKKISVADLILKVSKLMPDTVHLSGLSRSESQGTSVRFSVVGRDEEALETFLTALEDSPDFQDVAVVNEGIQTQGDASTPMTITCTARYMGSVLP